MTGIPRTYAALLLLLLAVGGIGYWFFMHTNRGSSWALYAIAGIRAPLKVRIDCAHSTDVRVEEKFQLPLNFTEDAKDALRGFWYYDYYRECLFSHGYDFSGRPVPVSTVIGTRYMNPYAGFGFSVPEQSELDTDNALDVDTDDRLHASEIDAVDSRISISAYIRDDTRRSLPDLEHIGAFPERLVANEPSVSAPGVEYHRLSDAAGRAAVAFRTGTDWTVFVTTSPSEPTLLESIARSLTLTE